MKVKIQRVSNGIHDYLNLIILNPEPCDLYLVEKLVKLVDAYNQEQIARA